MRHLIFILAISLFTISCGQNDTKQKELELRERELALKEKELDLKVKDSTKASTSTQTENKTLVQEANKSSTDKPISTIENSSSGGYNFDKHNDIKVFINDLRKAVSNDDRNTISQMINFPFVDEWGDNPYNQSPPLGCKTANQFFEKYDKIFVSSLKNAIISKKYRGYYEPPEGEYGEDVIRKGEYLIGGDYDGGSRIYWIAIKKVQGKFKIYAMKFLRRCWYEALTCVLATNNRLRRLYKTILYLHF